MSRFITRLPYILCYLIAFVFGIKQLREPDVWWQLLSGRWMLENGQITRTDPFSFTMAGRPWINVKWLYEIIIAGFEKLAGPEGVILLQAVVNVLIVHLLFRIAKAFANELKQPISDFAVCISALIFLALVEYRMAGRPEMVSHLLSATYLYILWRNPKMQLNRVWWLILLQCLWANMHEGYPVGMVIIGASIGGSLLAYIINRDKEYLQQTGRGLIIFVAAGLAILLNPNTTQLWKQPFEIYRQVWANKYTTELYSIADPAYWTIQAKAHVLVLVLVCAFWIARFIIGRKEKNNSVLLTPAVLGYLLLIPLFGYLSLDANRNIPFAQIVLFPSVVYMLGWVAEKLRLTNFKPYRVLAERAAVIFAVIGIAFYISIVSNAYYKATDSPNRYGAHISMLHNPTGVSSFIKRNNLKGPVFSDYFVSSYLLWDLYPNFKSYIDLRDLDVFPVDFFDNYFEMYNKPEMFDTLDQRYKFNYVVFSNSQLPPLQQRLYWGQGYNLLYVDPVSSLYLKSTPENEDINRRPELQKLFNWPEPSEDPAWAFALTKLLNPLSSYEEEEGEDNIAVQGAKFYNHIESYPTAIKFLLPYMGSMTDNAEAYGILGKSYLGFANKLRRPEEIEPKLDSALIFLNVAKDIDPNIATVYVSLADVNMMRSNFVAAKENYEEAIRLDSEKPMVYFYWGLSSYYMWKQSQRPDNRADAIDALDQCVGKDPQNKRAYIYLAELYDANGETGKAKESINKASAIKDPVFPSEQKLLDDLKKKMNMQ